MIKDQIREAEYQIVENAAEIFLDAYKFIMGFIELRKSWTIAVFGQDIILKP